MSVQSRERRLRGNLINVYEYLKANGRQMDETRFLSVVHSNRISSNGLKLEQRKFHTNMLNNFFMVRVSRFWSRLPGEVMESPVEILMTCLSAYLCDLLWCTCFSRGLEPMISSQPLQFYEKLSCLLA